METPKTPHLKAPRSNASEKQGSEKRSRFGEFGANMIEYVLVLGLIAIICIASLRLIGEDVSGTFSEFGSAIDSVN